MALEYKHGGNVYNANGENKYCIDFSANINPLGLSYNIKTAVASSVEFCENYPDPFSRELVANLSEFEGVEASNIICGNGAGDLIFRLALALKPRKALVLAPTFSEYENALKLVNCEVVYHYLKEKKDFNVTKTILDDIDNSLDMIFICNPNNPTGQVAGNVLMSKIIKLAESKKITVVVDECFMDFLDEGETLTVKNMIPDYSNLVVIKAFTKFFSMPGIRLGYAMTSNLKLIERLYEVAQPWSVSVIAQKVGVACLNEAQYVTETMKMIREERAFLTDRLDTLGLKVIGSHANYIFFKTEQKNLDKDLDDYDILIRNCKNYVGLEEGFFRVAVKSRRDNQMLIKALVEVLD